MRPAEKQIYKLVKKEARPLTEIANELQQPFATVFAFAFQLKQSGLIRLEKIHGTNDWIVCLPVKKDPFWKNFWATIIAAIVGALITVLTPMLQSKSQPASQAPILPHPIRFPPIVIIHDTLIVRDTIFVEKKK